MGENEKSMKKGRVSVNLITSIVAFGVNIVVSFFLTPYVIEKLGVDGIIVWQAPTGEIYYSSLDMDMVKRCDSLYEYVKE